ncbi:hypothetical protein ATANTOWER_007271 [Ataeniobius toweri]|uniref:Uncharacterized protein n=1 Tax=Ataeniobius toweri TaxID=208326 RepID=A0ABU7BNQ3_9TELE|nr:hypothetical protein [Ataeniobius toweri]
MYRTFSVQLCHFSMHVYQIDRAVLYLNTCRMPTDHCAKLKHDTKIKQCGRSAITEVYYLRTVKVSFAATVMMKKERISKPKIYWHTNGTGKKKVQILLPVAFNRSLKHCTAADMLAGFPWRRGDIPTAKH